MLYLIGLGLDKKDISLEALETIKDCDKIYLENYTTVFPYTAKDLEKVIKKKTSPAERKFLEEKNEMIELAKKKDVALLIYGDPLSATTHVDILMRAKKEKVKTKVLHAPSIMTAVAETGLQLYKFGKTGSIARWILPSFRPESFYDIVMQNQSIDAHTLLLLDIGLSVNDALSYLESMSRTKDAQIMDWDLIVVEKAGSDKQVISVGKVETLVKKKFTLPACMIVPGKLHFLEKEFLESVRKK